MASTSKNKLTTIYSSHSEDQLYCLFTDQSWSNLNADQRLAALQEVECRMAHKQGRPVCLIDAQPLPATSLGAFDGSRIVLNSNLLRSPRTLFGKIRIYGGITALDTIIHEGRHAFQRAAICGKTTVKVSDELRRTWAVNTVGYMDTRSAFSFYAFQPLERDAREYAAKNMSAIYRRIVRATGKSDVLFEKGLAQLRHEKEKEFQLARVQLSEERIQERLNVLAFRTALGVKLNVAYEAFGESVRISEFFAECGVTAEMLPELLEAQMREHRAILRGEKQLDHYMDGLLGESVDHSLDDALIPDGGVPPDNASDFPDHLDNATPETLDQLVDRLFHHSVKENTVDSSKIQFDIKKYRF